MPNTTNLHSNFPQNCYSRVLRLIVIFFLMTFLISACTGGDHTPPTEIATQIATEVPIVETAMATAEPTATETQAPTEVVVPSMENLPAEWQGKIDRVETMTNMDGTTTRVVAIEKLSDEDIAAGKTPVLRTLEWNGSEWVSYVPQVGLVGQKNGYWDYYAKSDELSGVELQKITAESIFGKDGQEIKLGLVADFSDMTLFCGDIIEVNSLDPGTEYIIKTTHNNGDIQLFQIGQITNVAANVLATAYDQGSIDPSRLTNPLAFNDSQMRTQVQEFSQLTPSQMVKFTDLLAQDLPRRVVFGISKSDTELMSNDSPAKRMAFVGQYAQGEVFNAEGIGINLYNSIVITKEQLNSLQQ